MRKFIALIAVFVFSCLNSYAEFKEKTFSSKEFHGKEFPEKEFQYAEFQEKEFQLVEFRYAEFMEKTFIYELSYDEYKDSVLMMDGCNPLHLDKILKDVAIAEGSMFVAAVVLSCIPGAQPFTAIIVAMHQIAVKGIILDAAIQGSVEYVRSEGDLQSATYRAIEGAADGYKWGAVIAVGAQGAKTIKDAKIAQNRTAGGKSVNFSSVADDVTPKKTGVKKLPPDDKLKVNKGYYTGIVHSETKVPYVRRAVLGSDGKRVVDNFPVFNSHFDAKLPKGLYKVRDGKQFAECTRQLQEKIMRNPKLAKQFTNQQLEQIKRLETPKGYTWHHNEIQGKMQLVDYEMHAKSSHLGGRSIWGGGGECRNSNCL